MTAAMHQHQPLLFDNYDIPPAPRTELTAVVTVSGNSQSVTVRPLIIHEQPQLLTLAADQTDGVQPTQLYAYQMHLANKAFQEIREGKKRVLVHAPTGAGKTVIMSHMIKRCIKEKKKVLMLAHMNELLDQTREKVLEAGILEAQIGMITAGSGVSSALGRSIYIASKATLNNRLADKTLSLDAFDVIMIDEAHRAAANTYARYFQSGLPIIGFTATPIRNGPRGLGGKYFDGFVLGPPMRELIEKGRLVQPKYFVAKAIITSEELAAATKASGDDYNEQKVAETIEENQKEQERTGGPTVYGDVLEAYLTHARNRQALLFAPSVATSRGFVQEFNASLEPKLIAEHIDGSTPRAERKRITEAFKRGEIDVISSVNVFTEGFDAPAASAIILCRPTKSLIFHLQSAGRGLRSSAGKSDCVIIDHVGNIMREGLGPVEQEQEWEQPGYTLSTRNGKLKPGASKCGIPAKECFCPTCGKKVPVPLRRRQRISGVGVRTVAIGQIIHRENARDYDVPAYTCRGKDGGGHAMYGDPEPFSCSECEHHVEISDTTGVCPACGFVEPRHRKITHAEQLAANIVQLDPETMRVIVAPKALRARRGADMDADMSMWWGSLQQHGIARRWKPGAAWHKFVARFGQTPAEAGVKRAPPCSVAPEVSDWLKDQQKSFRAKQRAGRESQALRRAAP